MASKRKHDHLHHDDHDHDHDHNHNHGHNHDHNHDHDHDHDHDYDEKAHNHIHDHDHGHAHGDSHEHTHPDSPGKYSEREPVKKRNFNIRGFTVGIGGPVGSGKTALVLSLCRHLRDQYNLVVVTNDIFTKEDGEFLIKNKALSSGRIQAVETGGCPHAAIREDCSANLAALEDLTFKFKPDICFVEAGGDNLAANFSRELADFIIYVIDVAGGDKIPRKGGPGITQSDLLVINKTDLAIAVGADLELMRVQAAKIRENGPVIFAQVKHMVNVDEISKHILEAMRKMTEKKVDESENEKKLKLES